MSSSWNIYKLRINKFHFVYSELAKQQIQQIVDRVSNLKPVEKLLLYLRLPGEAPESGITIGNS